jgi:hypothetical protein
MLVREVLANAREHFELIIKAIAKDNQIRLHLLVHEVLRSHGSACIS